MKSIFHTRRFQGLWAFAWALTMGCSGGGSGSDGGSGGSDLGIQDAAVGGADGGTTVTDLGVQSDLLDPNAPGIELLVGALGGSGDADGVGATARLGAVGAAYDGAGNLYLADGHGSIRKLATATGAVTTIAQTPAFPYDLAWEGAGSL